MLKRAARAETDGSREVIYFNGAIGSQIGPGGVVRARSDVAERQSPLTRTHARA